MIIFDALVGLFIFKIFGESGLWALAITCMLTIIRTCGGVNNLLDGMLDYTQELLDEEEEDK